MSKSEKSKRGRPITKYKLSMDWARIMAKKYEYLGSGPDDPYINDIILKYDNDEIHYEVAEAFIMEYLNKLFQDDYFRTKSE